MAHLSFSMLAISATLVLLALSSAFAQPCIECKECKTNNCLRNCQRTCPGRNSVSGDQCRMRGMGFGRTVAKDACDSAMKYCSGGPRALAARMGIGSVSRPQCANIAYGSCQQYAMNSRTSPCGMYFNKAYKSCSAKQFMDWYTKESDEMCGKQADTISN